MLSSKTCFLFTMLTILSKSRTNMTNELPNGSFSDESLSDGSDESETDSDEEKVQAYIVGGQYARIEDFPHSAFVVIRCYRGTYADFTCGGSILNQWLILTAAHCFENCRAGTQILVVVGARKKTKGKFYTVAKFANHGQYDGYKMRNDIAMAILAKPFKFSGTVKRVRLSRVGIYKEVALVAGWGVTNERLNTPSLYLKWARQIILPEKLCMQLLPRMTKGYLCATGYKKLEDSYGYAAVGDSGSALMVRGSLQIGIVSYKVPETSRSLVLYTDVTKYYNWILTTAKTLYCM